MPPVRPSSSAPTAWSRWRSCASTSCSSTRAAISYRARWADIRRQYVENRYRLTHGGEELPAALGERYELLKPTVSTVDIQLREGQSGNDLLRYLLDLGIRIQGFQELLPSLNEIFIKRVTRLNA